MSCAEVREDLVAFLDGELDLHAAESVHAHLTSCASCAGEQQRLARTGELLDRALVGGAAAPPVFARVAARLDPPARAADAPRRVGRRAGAGRLPAPRVVVALTAAAAAVALLVYSDPARPPESQSTQGAGRSAGTTESALSVANSLALPEELREHPDMFVDFVIVRRLEKLRQLPELLEAQAYDAIPPYVGRAG